MTQRDVYSFATFYQFPLETHKTLFINSDKLLPHHHASRSWNWCVFATRCRYSWATVLAPLEEREISLMALG